MVAVRSIRAKTGNEPVTMFTAYNAPTAGVVDETDIDIVLVSDSVGNTTLDYDSAPSVIVENVASRTAAVACTIDDALVAADMSFLSVGVDEVSSVEHYDRMLEKADVDAVKLECDPHTVKLTERLVRLGVPMMAHLGLTPRRIKEVGYGRQDIDRDDVQKVLDLAKAHAEAGAFSLVLEHIPTNLAKQVTETISIPTIDIGAGPDCDRQVLVVDDVVGMSNHTPPFATQFDNVKSEMERTVGAYRDAVGAGEFPTDEYSHVKDDLDKLY